MQDIVVLLDLQSKYFFFRCSAGLDPKGVMVRRMCVSTMRYCTCDTMSVRRCCHTGIMAPWCHGIVVLLRQDLGWLRRLHRQRLCRSVIPMIGLRGYVTNLQLIVIALLDILI
jgi:hypothetical protein